MAKPKHTEDELLDMLVEVMSDVSPLDVVIEPEDQLRVFEAMAQIDGAFDLMRLIMARDMRLYWLGKTDTDRSGVRGAFGRTAWFRAQMKNAGKHRLALTKPKA